MKGWKTDDYVDILRTVTNVVEIQPHIAICDFEKAEQKALKIVFPHAKVIGCFFHYSQVRKNLIIYLLNATFDRCSYMALKAENIYNK